MTDREEANELLQVAERDLRALGGMLDSAVFADEVFGFVAQQAAEKALKAWLCIAGLTYPLTYDLSGLLARLQDAGEDVSGRWDLTDLNPYAVTLRYGTLSLDEQPLDRRDILGRVVDLINAVRRMIGPPPPPSSSPSAS